MGEQHQVQNDANDQQLRSFVRALLKDVHALEMMLDRGMIESGVRRIGAEQEMFIVDRACRPALVVQDLLDRLKDPQFTTELARFNLEANCAPQVFGGNCLSRMEQELLGLVQKARDAAAEVDAQILIAGILPTLELQDLSLEAMVPNVRYRTLNDAMRQLRGGVFRFRIKGTDELDITHDNVMLESCNTSFQVHFQVGHEEFARYYNLAQAVAAPVLAAAVNSPLLLGRRLWEETRVALFQQSVDSRSETHQARGHRPRVSFGDRWIQESVLEIFREDIARFRVLLATGIDEDPQALVARGQAPKLTALRLHNGTVYRWNRACYGVMDGKAHLRIEMRPLPAGPTVRDEVANAAFFFGLMSALLDEYGEIHRVMEFDAARQNFVAAARLGLKAQFTWVKGQSWTAERLILEHLLPLARQGLQRAKLDAKDVDTYLGVLEQRVRSGQTGANWIHRSLAQMSGQGSRDQRLRALARGTVSRQRTNEPVHTWTPAALHEAGDWRFSYLKVGQYMTTDLFTVRPQDLVDLAASLMEWEHIRHVPVEDDQGRLVGLVSHRQLLRLIGRNLAGETTEPAAVREIMQPDPVTVNPETSTVDAIGLMRKHKVGCLPVLANDRLVGLVTEHDLLEVAAKLMEDQAIEAPA